MISIVNAAVLDFYTAFWLSIVRRTDLLQQRSLEVFAIALDSDALAGLSQIQRAFSSTEEGRASGRVFRIVDGPKLLLGGPDGAEEEDSTVVKNSAANDLPGRRDPRSREPSSSDRGRAQALLDRAIVEDAVTRTPEDRNPTTTAREVALADAAAKQIRFGGRSFARLTSTRPAYLERFLRAGYSTLYFDVDVILTRPGILDEIQRSSTTERTVSPSLSNWKTRTVKKELVQDVSRSESDQGPPAAPADYDLPKSIFLVRDIWPPTQDWGVCSCLVLLHPHPDAFELLEKWKRGFLLDDSGKMHDQLVLQELTSDKRGRMYGAWQRRISDVRVESFPPGRVYEYAEGKKAAKVGVMCHGYTCYLQCGNPELVWEAFCVGGGWGGAGLLCHCERGCHSLPGGVVFVVVMSRRGMQGAMRGDVLREDGTEFRSHGRLPTFILITWECRWDSGCTRIGGRGIERRKNCWPGLERTLLWGVIHEVVGAGLAASEAYRLTLMNFSPGTCRRRGGMPDKNDHGREVVRLQSRRAWSRRPRKQRMTSALSRLRTESFRLLGYDNDSIAIVLMLVGGRGGIDEREKDERATSVCECWIQIRRARHGINSWTILSIASTSGQSISKIVSTRTVCPIQRVVVCIQNALKKLSPFPPQSSPFRPWPKRCPQRSPCLLLLVCTRRLLLSVSLPPTGRTAGRTRRKPPATRPSSRRLRPKRVWLRRIRLRRIPLRRRSSRKKSMDIVWRTSATRWL